MKYIGINGGTFDPVHYGHLRPALEVMQALNLDQVQFIPCYQPVHKGKPNVSAFHRSEMIGLAIANQPKFALNTIEIDKGGPSYTVETLTLLKQEFSEDSLVLMMGTDAFAKFHTWHQWQRILQLANIVIMHRPGEPVPHLGTAGEIFQQHHVAEFDLANGQIMDREVTQLDISSTMVREHLKLEHSAEYLLPYCVVQYIDNHGLYQNNQA